MASIIHRVEQSFRLALLVYTHNLVHVHVTGKTQFTMRQKLLYISNLAYFVASLVGIFFLLARALTTSSAVLASVS